MKRLISKNLFWKSFAGSVLCKNRTQKRNYILWKTLWDCPFYKKTICKLTSYYQLSVFLVSCAVPSLAVCSVERQALWPGVTVTPWWRRSGRWATQARECSAPGASRFLNHEEKQESMPGPLSLEVRLELFTFTFVCPQWWPPSAWRRS